MIATKKVINTLETCFKVVYLLLAIVTFNVFLTHTPVSNVFAYFVVFFGFAVVVIRTLYYKNYIKTHAIWMLLAMLVFYGISSLINYKYGGKSDLIENVQAMVWMALNFFVLYAYNNKTDKKQVIKEFKIFTAVFLIYNFIADIVGIAMMFLNYGDITVREENTIISGFVWSRLWGAYTDPNHGSVISAVCIILSLYCILNKPKGIKLAFHIVNILVSLMYISYSDSRTGLVALICGLVFFVCLWFIKKDFKITKTKFVKCLVCGLLSLTIAVGTYYAIFGIQNVTTEIRMAFYNEEDPSINIEEIEIGRDQVTVDPEDISNRRFDIWKSGLEIFSKSPVFGTSYRGMVSFAKTELPETYLVNNDVGVFNAMHNSLLDILVGQGAIGFLAFLIFAILVFINFFKGYAKIKGKENYILFITITSVIITIAVSSLFISEIMYHNAIGCIIFWAYLGYSMQVFKFAMQEESETIAKENV